MDVVFSDSACGSLKVAQHYGKGPCPKSVIGVAIGHHNGNKPTQQEMEALKQEMENREKLAWERAKPMGGNSADIFGLSLALSVGDISEDIPGKRRQQMLSWLFGAYPLHEGNEATTELFCSAKDALATICNRIKAGEALRIWYSTQPDDLCGLYWLMTQIGNLRSGKAQISLVKLPEWEVDELGNTIQHSGWGEVHPGEWHRYLPLETPAPPTFCQGCATHWQALQKENAPLRAVLNGQLVSMEESLYDGFIQREIDAADEIFQEANVIGRVLRKYRLGIGDTWVAHRIESMIQQGELEPVSKAPADGPTYHRMLKKSKNS